MITDKQFAELSEEVKQLSKNYLDITNCYGALMIQLRASDDALLTILGRYAQCLRTSPRALRDEYDEIFEDMHERLLLKAEECDPFVAGLLDKRPIEGLD